MRCYVMMMLAMAVAMPVLAQERDKAPRDRVRVLQRPLFEPQAKPRTGRRSPRIQPPPGFTTVGPIVANSGPTGRVIDFVRRNQDAKGNRLERLGDGNEFEFLSDLVANLLSGNEVELLSGNSPSLLSGNEVELLSGNEVELLSGNALLSNNEAELFSGNSASFMSGNQFSLSINISESGNNSGNEGGGQATSFSKLDRDHNGRVSLQEFRGKRQGKKARRARRRFTKLDRNADGSLSAVEMGAKRRR